MSAQTAESVRLVVHALRAVTDAIRDEREARLTGEYSDGMIWFADLAIDRLQAHLDEMAPITTLTSTEETP